MKKVFALLLVLALLVPMVLTAQAEAVEAKPFYGLGWSDYDNEKYPHMEGLATFSITNIGDKVKMSYGGATLTAGSIDKTSLDKMVAALKKTMDARPAGMRYIHFFGPARAFGLAPQNVVYLDHGVNQLTELTSAIFEAYHAIGGQVDGAIMSALYTAMGSYYIRTNDAKKDPLIYSKIVKDPRYATEIRPMLAERGFKFYDDANDYTPEIYGISGNAGSQYSNCAAIWDTVMRIRLNAYITKWAYAPMAKYFPDVYVSDYQSADNAAWLKGANNDGNLMGSGGNSIKAGNTSCENFYSGRPTDAFYATSGQPVFKTPTTYTGAVYEDTAFKAFLYDMNVAKRVYASTDNQNVCYWISRFNGGEDNNTAVTGTPYYSEQVFHLCLYDPKPFVVFLAREQFPNDQAFELCESVANALLAEVSRVAGYADRKPIALPMNWNSEFVLTGMYANGRNIWRITPNRDLVTREAFRVEGKDPTFSIAGQTVTFPGGKIIEDSPISHIGTYGYWVETAADVTPVVTNDADRFEKNPAYTENFESYDPGTKLVAMNIRDQGGWVVQPKGSDMVVTAQGENKLLSVTGNSLLQNKQIPANVTAGDIYAPDQSWSLTVTVPAGMGGALTLLDYQGEKQEGKDGGFQISGGKVYYSEMGVYKELALDISAGGEYVFTRVMDFHTAGSFSCDYLVTDGAGKELAGVKGVAVPAFTGKVESIDITCKGVTGNVLLDDYTLRATGAAADLFLYDTQFGTKVDTPRKESTTYRLSWMNASAKEETATVMAAYYEGQTLKEEKVLKEISLQPGCDGVEYGTVEGAEGQTVKVYLKTTVKPVVSGAAAPTTPTEPTTAPTVAETTSATEAAPTDGSEKGGSTGIVIAVIAIVAVVAIGVVLVVIRKKPGKK